MIKQPANTDELYAFFVPNLIKPPMKPNSICSGIQLDRPGWHVEVYHIFKTRALHMWFYTHPSRGPKWASLYDKFTDPSKES